MISITHCPNCGSGAVRPIRRDWTGETRGKSYTVPRLAFHECPDCGERIFDREAMRRIEERSPAFAGSISRPA
ncbi:MAG: YgiT-type zinc finger protein [Bryobacteraceae bacterium]